MTKPVTGIGPDTLLREQTNGAHERKQLCEKCASRAAHHRAHKVSRPAGGGATFYPSVTHALHGSPPCGRASTRCAVRKRNGEAGGMRNECRISALRIPSASRTPFPHCALGRNACQESVRRGDRLPRRAPPGTPRIPRPRPSWPSRPPDVSVARRLRTHRRHRRRPCRRRGEESRGR